MKVRELFEFIAENPDAMDYDLWIYVPIVWDERGTANEPSYAAGIIHSQRRMYVESFGDVRRG